MEQILIQLIENIINNHTKIINIALRQKAKFEGWLKFELAQSLENYGVSDLSVEHLFKKGSRVDISFIHNKERYLLELKTSNTNWVVSGIESKTRPITKNIDSIIDDGIKLAKCEGVGLVVFLLFPIPTKDKRWKQYLNRITNLLEVTFIENINYKLVETNHEKINCQILISAFKTVS